MNHIEIGSYSPKTGWKQKQQLQKVHNDQAREQESGRATARNAKKTNTKKSGKRKPRRLKKLFAGCAMFLVLGFCGFLFYNFGNRVPGVNVPLIQPAQSLCTNLLDPKCWTDNFRPKLKQTEGYTNFLVVGLDTRENDSGLLNTDTIVLLSFDHNTQETMLISIPRDFYSPKYATRINAIYAFTKDRDKTDPFRYLKEEVSSITGQEIHYFATVKFDTFKDVVDEFNGIEVCPEEAFTAQYPNENSRGGSQWVYHDFQKGCQTVTGEKALVYARFRYVSKGPSSLASDFSRARRQQEVIEAIKDKALSQDMSISDRSSKYWGLLQSFRQNIDTNIGFEDILAGLGQVNAASKQPLNVVLDPAFGGMNSLIITDSSSGAYYIKAKDSTYANIKKELQKIRENPELYKEQPSILVKNQSKTYLNTVHPVKTLEQELVFKQSFTYKNEFGKADFTGIKLVDFTNGEKPETKKQIMDELDIVQETDPSEVGIVQSSAKEDFVIIVGLPLTSPSGTL